jgi:hypothetical protein
MPCWAVVGWLVGFSMLVVSWWLEERRGLTGKVEINKEAVRQGSTVGTSSRNKLGEKD